MSPRDAEERRIAGGGVITPKIVDDEAKRITGLAINWVGRDAEEARKGANGH